MLDTCSSAGVVAERDAVPARYKWYVPPAQASVSDVVSAGVG